MEDNRIRQMEAVILHLPILTGYGYRVRDFPLRFRKEECFSVMEEIRSVPANAA